MPLISARRRHRRMTSTGSRSPRFMVSPSRKLDQASVRISAPPATQPTNTGLPSVVMPHAASTGSPREPVCILDRRTHPDQDDQVRGHPTAAGSTPPAPREWPGTPTRRSTCSTPPPRRGTMASVASTSRVDNPRTNPAITGVSNAFDRVMPLPNSREQNCSVVPRSFGR